MVKQGKRQKHRHELSKLKFLKTDLLCFLDRLECSILNKLAKQNELSYLPILSDLDGVNNREAFSFSDFETEEAEEDSNYNTELGSPIWISPPSPPPQSAHEARKAKGRGKKSAAAKTPKNKGANQKAEDSDDTPLRSGKKSNRPVTRTSTGKTPGQKRAGEEKKRRECQKKN
jgi:hypothetical protein